MKTTINLPVEVVRGLKLHAVRHGRKMRETALEVLRAGTASVSNTRPILKLKTLPRIKARRIKSAGVNRISAQEMSDWVKQADLQGETDRYEKAFGH